MANFRFGGLFVAGALLVFGALPVQAQDGPQNLDAGKSPAQLFASDCAVCHKSPQGLAKSGSLFGLAGFLREHYTASKETAAALASFLEAAGGERAPPARPRQAKKSPKGDDKAKSGEIKAGDKKTDGSKPGEAKPADAKPADAKPADVKPSDTKPAESKPAEPKATETKPAEDKPSDTKTASPEQKPKTPSAVKPADGASEKKS